MALIGCPGEGDVMGGAAALSLLELALDVTSDGIQNPDKQKDPTELNSCPMKG